jgi:hypothetical protein
MAYNNDDYGYGYGSGRDYYRSRRRRRNPFSDGNLAALGKLYADVPVDSVTKAITGLKENYYRNRDLKDKYDQALAQAMVMEGDQQTKQDLINKIRQRVDEFSEKGDAYETGDDFIRSIAKDVTGNPALFQMLENKKIYDEKQKLVDEMSAKGLAPIYLDDPNFRSVGPEGKLNTYDAYVGSTVNRRPMLENFFNNLKANNESYANQLLDVFTTKGVDQERIDQVVSGAMPMLQSTKEYQQSLNNEKAKAQYTGVPFDQNAFDAEWFQNLKDVGKEFMYKQKSVNYNTGASRATLGGGNISSGRNPNNQTLNPGLIGGAESDNWWGRADSAGWSDDDFNYRRVTGTKNTQDYDVNTITNIKPSGKIINMTNSRGEERRFTNGNTSQNFNAQFTGEAGIYQVVMDPGRDGIYLNEAAINKAFQEKVGWVDSDNDGLDDTTMAPWSGMSYNAAHQDIYKNELPFTGSIGGMFTNERWGNLGPRGLEPETLTVNGHTLQYLYVDDKVHGSGPIFLKDTHKGTWNTFADIEGNDPQGQILMDLLPEQVVAFDLDSNGVGWQSLEIDAKGQISNVRPIDKTIQKLSHPNFQGNEIVQAALNAAIDIKRSAQQTGDLTVDEINALINIDNYVMPRVLRAIGPGVNPDPDLTKKKFISF